MRSIRRVVALLATILPAAAMAQPSLPTAVYISGEIGTGKVSLSCGPGVECSPVDSSLALRVGYRLDASWALEVMRTHTDSDFTLFVLRESAEYTGFTLGAAYTLPLSSKVSTLARFGVASNELEYQPYVDFLQSSPGTVTTRSVKPYVGLGLSWQFARHWSTSLNADWTWADMRHVANGPKERVGVRTLGAGIAFHF